MNQDKVYLEETPEQEEILDEVMTMLAVVVKEFAQDVDVYNLPLEESTRALFNNDEESFGIVIAKLHVFFGLGMPFENFSEFEEFLTLDSVFQYFGERVLRKKGLW